MPSEGANQGLLALALSEAALALALEKGHRRKAECECRFAECECECEKDCSILKACLANPWKINAAYMDSA